MQPPQQQLKNSGSYGSTPCYWELAAVIGAGVIHVLSELFLSESAAKFSNLATSLIFGSYVVWRIRSTPCVFRIWGMRSDNLRASLRAHLGFASIGAVAIFGIGATLESGGLPMTFWIAICLYPIYGVIQQFALQNLIAKNLSNMLSNPVWLAIVAAVLFALSHFPRLELVALTLIAGVFFTLIYRRVPNLWAVGLAHGLLGTLASYLVLGEDPGGEILFYIKTL